MTPDEVFRTADLARAAGTHVNTVRFYEEMGFLPPAERGPNGYRLWTREHRDQMVFARKALHGLWPGRRIRASALDLVRKA
ncbi:MAG: MerR family DNA-binding transcriptional regulator, partial [Treponema sp.]|nr:MerR family DNA-binding transcriptional regulator [Treponema sp.]